MKNPITNRQFDPSDREEIDALLNETLVQSDGAYSKVLQSNSAEAMDALTDLEEGYLNYRLRLENVSRKDVEEFAQKVKKIVGNRTGQLIIDEIYAAVDDAIDEKLGAGRSR